MRKVVLYIAVSIDGYIARTDNNLDWLTRYNDSGEDYGYTPFLSSVDTVIMGNNTYKQILGFGAWPYPEKKCVVFSRENHENTEHAHFSTTPIQTVKELKEQVGKGIWIVGGGKIVSALMEEKLIDRIILTIVPVVLGRGIPLFPEMRNETEFKLEKTEQFASGLAQLVYVLTR